jgi:hypothetical protein
MKTKKILYFLNVIIKSYNKSLITNDRLIQYYKNINLLFTVYLVHAY